MGGSSYIWREKNHKNNGLAKEQAHREVMKLPSLVIFKVFLDKALSNLTECNHCFEQDGDWPDDLYKIPSNLAHSMILLRPSWSMIIRKMQIWTETRVRRIWHTGWPPVPKSTSAFWGSNALVGELCFPT